MARRSPWLVRFFTRHVKRFYLAQLPCGPAVKEWQTGSGAGRPADRRAQSPLLVGPAGRPGADRVVSGPCPLLRPWTRTRYGAIGSSSVWAISVSSGKQREGLGSSSAPSCAILARATDRALDHGSGPLRRRARTAAGHSTRSGSSRTPPGTGGHSAAGSGVSLLGRALSRSAGPVRPGHRCRTGRRPDRRGVAYLH